MARAVARVHVPLDEAGYDCYVVSNGNPEMLASMVDHADIEDLLVDTISADEVETFKPDSEIYSSH